MMKPSVTRKSLLGFALGLFLLLFGTVQFAFAQVTPPDCGDASSFAVLAGNCVNNSEASGCESLIEGGDVGALEAVSNIDPEDVKDGDIYVGGAKVTDALEDCEDAYNALLSLTPDETLSWKLTGTNTLTPGVYAFDKNNVRLGGTLTLDGAGVYVFQINGNLTVKPDTQILLSGDATLCNTCVFWVAKGDINIGAGSCLIGKFISGGSITVGAGQIAVNDITPASIEDGGAEIYGTLCAAGDIYLDRTLVSKPVCLDFTVTKTADKTTASVNDTITYTVTITNTGNTVIKKGMISISDSLVTIPTPITYIDTSFPLDPGESAKTTYTYTVLPGDAGTTLTNTVSVTINGMTKTAQASVTIAGNEPSGLPGISITKKANVGSAGVGKRIIYTLQIENTGDVTLTNIRVLDPMFGTGKLAGFPTTLAPGEKSNKVTFMHLVTCSDPNPLVNTAKVVALIAGTRQRVSDTATLSIPRCSAGGGTEPGPQAKPDIMIYNSAYKNIQGANVYNHTGNNQTQTQNVCSTGSSIIFPIRVENDDPVNAGNFLVTAYGTNPGWTVTFYNAMNGGRDITSQVMNGGWNPTCEITTMGPNRARDFIVVITPTSSVDTGDMATVNIVFTNTDTGAYDVAKAVVVMQ